MVKTIFYTNESGVKQYFCKQEWFKTFFTNENGVKQFICELFEIGFHQFMWCEAIFCK